MRTRGCFEDVVLVNLCLINRTSAIRLNTVLRICVLQDGLKTFSMLQGWGQFRNWNWNWTQFQFLLEELELELKLRGIGIELKKMK